MIINYVELKERGKNVSVRAILKQNILFQSRKTYEFGIKRILFFRYFLTI